MNTPEHSARSPVAIPLHHLDAAGQARMVDVGHKPVQRRLARAEGRLVCSEQTARQLREVALPKGDALAVARVAGLLAVKRTAELIPLCHPLPLSHASVDLSVEAAGVQIVCTVTTEARTGVEMEALTGVAVAALALYDLCKGVDPALRIEGIRLVEKTKSPPTRPHPGARGAAHLR